MDFYKKLHIVVGGVITAIFFACSENSTEIQQAETPLTVMEMSSTEEASVKQEPLLKRTELNSFQFGEIAASAISNDTIYIKLSYETLLLNASMKIVLNQPISAINFAGSEVPADSTKLGTDSAVYFFTANLTEPSELKIVSARTDTLGFTVVPSFTNLPTVFITTPNFQEITSKEEWVSGTKIVIANAGAENAVYTNSSIRGRGNSTWAQAKKPYALKLSSKRKVLGMAKHKRWVLLANYFDRSLIRNALTFELGRQTALAWTPNGEFVNLVLNGVLLGNYYLCEQIKVDKNRVNITEMSASDLGEETITGGYLLEYDVNYDEVNKFKTATKNYPVNIKEPDEDVLQSEQFTHIENYINEMEVLLTGNAPDSLAGKTWRDYLDDTSFADFWIVNTIAGNTEIGFPKSCYFNKERGGRIKAGPLWDFDYETFRPGYALVRRDLLYYPELFKDTGFTALVKERWEELYPKFLALTSFIDTQIELLAESGKINDSLWPEISVDPNGEAELSANEAELRLRETFLERLEILDAEISGW